MDMPQARSWDEVEVHLASIQRRLRALERQVHDHDEELETFVRTVWWKRWLFIIDGWSGRRVVDRPRWRPWRRWWTS